MAVLFLGSHWPLQKAFVEALSAFRVSKSTQRKERLLGDLADLNRFAGVIFQKGLKVEHG